MRKLFLIAHSNMRKARGQTFAIIVLILLAALMLNLGLMLSMDYQANFKRYHSQLNAEHVTLSVDGDTDEVREFLIQTLEENHNVSDYLLNTCLSMTGSFPYNGGEMNSWFIFMEKDLAITRSIGKIEIVEDSPITSGVYLPMLYKSEDIDVGKTIEMFIGSHSVHYTICGFFNSVMMGSHNCSLTEIVLTVDQYEALSALGYAPQATLCSVRLQDISQNLSFEADLKSMVSKAFPNILMMGNSYDIVAQSRYISQSICSSIMNVMAFFTLLIALVVIVSNIINYVQINIKNLGALKAVGYTSKQLISSLLVQFLGLTFFMAIIGTGLSYCFFPAINTMMMKQTGIPYTIHFLPLPVLISLLILCSAVALFVWFAAHRIQKIEPIVALRAGIRTHNFKRNAIPLEKTKAPLNLALALKTTLSGVKHNLTVCITMMILALIVVFSGLMTENVIVDMTPFLNLIVGETADSCINVDIGSEQNFLEVLQMDNRVQKAYLYHSLNVSHDGGANFVATLSDDFSQVNNQNVVFKGRYPKYDNEIAIAAKYAKENGFEVGDEIDIAANGKVQTYLISGFTQISNNLGRDCLLTRKGYERLGMLSNVSYYINLTDDTDIDAFNAQMQERFSDSVFAVINIDKTIQGSGGVYVSLMTIIVIAILILSVLIIAFVLYLLVCTMLNNKKRDYGILKSLGFTNQQLILQTALSFMPSVIFSTIVGIIISCVAINPLTSIFLSGIGIVKCTFHIPVVFVTIAGILLILLSFGIACLLSLKIKKIAPRALLVGE